MSSPTLATYKDEGLQSNIFLQVVAVPASGAPNFSGVAAIPLMSFTPSTQTVKKDVKTGAHIDSDGTLWNAETITARGQSYDCKTKRLRASDGKLLAASLKLIRAAARKTGPAARLAVQVTEDGDVTVTGVFNVTDCKPFGDNVDDVAAFEFKLESYGIVTTTDAS